MAGNVLLDNHPVEILASPLVQMKPIVVRGTLSTFLYITSFFSSAVMRFVLLLHLCLGECRGSHAVVFRRRTVIKLRRFA